MANKPGRGGEGKSQGGVRGREEGEKRRGVFREEKRERARK